MLVLYNATRYDWTKGGQPQQRTLSDNGGRRGKNVETDRHETLYSRHRVFLTLKKPLNVYGMHRESSASLGEIVES